VKLVDFIIRIYQTHLSPESQTLFRRGTDYTVGIKFRLLSVICCDCDRSSVNCEDITREPLKFRRIKIVKSVRWWPIYTESTHIPKTTKMRGTWFDGIQF